MEKLYTVSKNKTVAQIMNSLLENSDKLKKVQKTTTPFRYDLNQIPYNYTVEITNRFKGLGLTECLMNYGRRFVTFTGDEDQDHPKKKKCKKQNGSLRRPYK